MARSEARLSNREGTVGYSIDPPGVQGRLSVDGNYLRQPTAMRSVCPESGMVSFQTYPCGVEADSRGLQNP